MANIAKLYDEAIRAKVEDEEPKQEGTAEMAQELSLQTKFQWMQHPTTQELFKKLAEEEKELIDLAISCATSVNTPINFQAIVSSLIKVNQIRQIRRTYGNPR